MDRRTIALRRIDITKGKGLELGPLFSPLVSKDEADISYADHVSTEGLKEKYEGHPINGHPLRLEDIAPIDYALGDNSLKDTIKRRKFDYVIASHVMEHIPDLVSWFADVSAVLKDGGILSLVIPDKRYTFDILRNESRPADVVGAYLDKHTRASSSAMYDYMNNFRQEIVAAEVWQDPHADYSKKPKLSFNRAYELCLENIEPDNYVDSHCFVFTPYSFFEIIRALIKHDLFDYEIAYFKDTPENQLEFYVSLRKAPASSRARKLRSIPRLPKPRQDRELQEEILRLRSELEEAQRFEAELQNVINSKSWRITRPIRGATRLAKTIRRK